MAPMKIAAAPALFQACNRLFVEKMAGVAATEMGPIKFVAGLFGRKAAGSKDLAKAAEQPIAKSRDFGWSPEVQAAMEAAEADTAKTKADAQAALEAAEKERQASGIITLDDVKGLIQPADTTVKSSSSGSVAKLKKMLSTKETVRKGNGTAVAVIMVGGPAEDGTDGPRFGPLGKGCTKPLFPVAGKPMAYHAVKACKGVAGLSAVFLVGAYTRSEMMSSIDGFSRELGLSVSYLSLPKETDTVSALAEHENALSGFDTMFVAPADVCSSFPFSELAAAKEHAGGAVKLVKKGAKGVSTGIFAVSPSALYSEIEGGLASLEALEGISTYEADGIFETIKTPGAALRASKLYLAMMAAAGSKDLAKAAEQPIAKSRDFGWSPEVQVAMEAAEADTAKTKADAQAALEAAEKEQQVMGNVVIDPSAKIHPGSKIGPNVTIGHNVVIGPGARVMDSIVLGDAHVGANAVVVQSVIGWGAKVGAWARVHGEGAYEEKLGVTVLGQGVEVGECATVASCFVLPHKVIRDAAHGEVVL